MDFKECIENNIITKTSPDLSRAVKMVETADIRYRFWDKDIDDEFITLKVEAYYEIIKELILAIIYKNGYTCHNHICLISYLKENINDFDYEIQKIDELRMIRNEINYRGLSIKKEYMLRNELEFKNIITKLKEFASIIM